MKKMATATFGVTAAMLVFFSAAVYAQDVPASSVSTKEEKNIRLEIPQIPYFDSSLDKFDEVSPFDFELGFSLASAYIWRGQNVGSDTSFQPYVKVSPSFEPFGDLSFTFWTDITKDSPGTNDREHDYIVDYTFSVLEGAKLLGYSDESSPKLLTKMLDFNFDTGYTYYQFPPKPATKSQEVYFGMTYNLPLSPSFYVYQDWDLGRGIWYEWKISHDFDLKYLTLSTYAKLGFNQRQWGTTSALSVLDFGGSIPIPGGSHMKISPFLSYSKRLKPTYTNDETDLVHDELYGGMNYSIVF
jgi:hypothetical protein